MNNINNFHILSLWNLFETEIVANGAVVPLLLVSMYDSIFYFYLKPYLKVIEGGSVFYAIIMSTSMRQTRNGSTALSGPMFNFSENPQFLPDKWWEGDFRNTFIWWSDTTIHRCCKHEHWAIAWALFYFTQSKSRS